MSLRRRGKRSSSGPCRRDRPSALLELSNIVTQHTTLLAQLVVEMCAQLRSVPLVWRRRVANTPCGRRIENQRDSRLPSEPRYRFAFRSLELGRLKYIRFGLGTVQHRLEHVSCGSLEHAPSSKARISVSTTLGTPNVESSISIPRVETRTRARDERRRKTRTPRPTSRPSPRLTCGGGGYPHTHYSL